MIHWIQLVLGQTLRNSAEAFRLMRYIYEGHQVDFFIWEFPRMVSDLILEKHPSWNDYDFSKLPRAIEAKLPNEIVMQSKFQSTPPKG